MLALKCSRRHVASRRRQQLIEITLWRAAELTNCRVTGFLFAEENSMTDFHSRRYARQQYLWRSWDSFIYFHLLTSRRKRKRYNCAFIAMLGNKLISCF